ncbi:MAG TPA: winged helix-turn-helix domain-containing protein [Pyrinomonadaceae bacterium]|jgi:TolB-like protein/Tfp pilus assembly protein PilF
MSKDNKNSTVYEFDDVVIDSSNFRVFKAGQTKKITPRAFEILLFLIGRNGQLVSKQELFEAIWKESFVTDNALTRMVKEIRQVIGDDADSPRFIETVPKRGYRFIAETKSVKTAKSAADTENQKDVSSIAVLPFINLSGDSDNDYLSEGITESIINNLSRLEHLRVVPRSTISYFQGRDINPLDAGRQLNVRTVLSGRVLKRNEILIVNVEFVDVSNKSQLWGEQFRYKTSDIFDLQEEISRTISAQLELKFDRKTQNQSIERPTDDPDAYRLYLKGRYFWNRRPLGLTKGIECFEQALEKDSNFALAYAGLADCYSTLGSWENGALPPAIAMPKACQAAQKALTIDNNLAEAQTTLAYTKLHYDWDFESARAGFEYALKLNRNYVHAYHWLSHYYIATGQIEKSLEASLCALELEPLDSIINGHVAWHYWMARQPDEALRQVEKTRELNPHDIWSSFFGGLAFEEKGLFKEAGEEFKRALDVSPEFSLVQAALVHALGCNNQLTEAREIIKTLVKHRARKFIPAYDLAIAYLGVNKKDSALAWLKEAVAERSGWIAYLAVEPRLEPLHSSPEFALLIKNTAGQSGAVSNTDFHS